MGKSNIKSKKKDVTKVADGFENFVSRVGVNPGLNNTISQSYYSFNLLTNNRMQLEAAYRGSWIVGQVVDVIANDMTRAGIEIYTNEAAEQIEDLQAQMDTLQIWNSVADFIRWSRLYGGAIAVLQTEGQDLSTPLNYNAIGKGQFKGLAVYDRWQLNPALEALISDGAEIGLPEYYQIVGGQGLTDSRIDPAMTGVKIHHTRVIRGIGIQLPYYQAITNMLWGESVIERLYDRLISFDNATMSSASLIDRAQLRTVRIENLRQILSSGGQGEQNLLSMFKLMSYLQTNEGLTLLDKADEFQTTSYSFAGLSDMMLQFGQQLAGACGIPLVRLFGQSPAGLSSTGESDLRTYYDNINSEQNSRLRVGMDKILHVLYRSMYGEALPADFRFKFAPLWQMSQTDKATIAKTSVESIIMAYDSGLLDKATAMKELRKVSLDTGMFSNITDEAIEEAANELPLPDIETLPLETQQTEVVATEQDLQQAKDSKPGKLKSWLKRK